MRLYSQLTSGQILFSALSNWEFFMVKDKRTRGWKNLIKELSDTTHLFEMKWRPERGRRRGRRVGGTGRPCPWPSLGPEETSQLNRGWDTTSPLRGRRKACRDGYNPRRQSWSSPRVRRGKNSFCSYELLSLAAPLKQNVPETSTFPQSETLSFEWALQWARCLYIWAHSFFFTYWSIVDEQCCVSFSKVNQSYICMYLFFFKWFSHLGYYRILSRVSCVIQ